MPGTVENFVALAAGQAPGGLSYKGASIHRVMADFMVQVRRRLLRAARPLLQGPAYGRQLRRAPGRGVLLSWGEGRGWGCNARAQQSGAPRHCALRARRQTGDVLNGDGTGTFSAWDGIGGTFADEDLKAFTHERGSVSMANTGPDTNSARGSGRAGGWGWQGACLLQPAASRASPRPTTRPAPARPAQAASFL